MQYKKTKIVATLGPASSSREVIEGMVKAGMNVVRLNFSHGDNEEKKEKIRIIRELSRQLNKPMAIIADLQGPKLRLGNIEGQVEIQKGETIQLAYNPTNPGIISLQFDLAPFMQPGQRIFLNDGLVELKVGSVENGVIFTTAQNDGWVASAKGVNIPDTHLIGVIFTEKDRADAEFALEQNVDYIAQSFVQTAQDIVPVRDLIREKGAKTQIIVKIEKKGALNNLESIIQNADAVMVARGDLAIETSAAEVPVEQQRIIRLGRQYQKPVIVATQMLESMIQNPRPTRAEASDVAHAVLFQVDGVMLSAESAVGKYPVETVQVMQDIILTVEKNPDYKQYIHLNWEKLSSENLCFNAISSSAVSLAYKINSPLIAVATATGRTPHLISSFRPDTYVLAVPHDEKISNQLSLLWGVHSAVITPTATSEEFWQKIMETVREMGWGKPGEQIVMVGGTIVGVTGATDTIKVKKI